MSNKVAILGGAGYVGSHAAKAVRDAGLTPLVVDDLRTGHEWAVQWGGLERCDIRDTPRLAAILSDHRVLAVMHFAASIEVGIGEARPLSFYENNVAGTVSVLKAMAQAGVTELVFSSTCAVYGATAGPLIETMPRAPASVYARTKSMAEVIIEDVASASELRAIILRYFNASGADQSGTIGEAHEPETHLIPNALKAAAGLGPPLKLFGDDYDTPDGTCLRDYVHVSDLARAHVAALNRLTAAAAAGRVEHYNLGTGRPYSVREVIAAVEAVTGRAVPYTTVPRRAGDVAVLTADVTGARLGLGYVPVYVDLIDIVRTAWIFHQRQWKV